MMYDLLQYEVAQEQHKDYLAEAQKYALVQQALANASADGKAQSVIGRMARLFGRSAGPVPQGFQEQRQARSIVLNLVMRVRNNA